jgi:hypothetical protein
MRIWSIHPSYLDAKGLVACWRESLLAQEVLLGNTKGYKNHPQLIRFRKCDKPLDAIGRYLLEIYAEAEVRGYNFDSSKIKGKLTPIYLTVTKGQLQFEFEHLYKKLIERKSGKTMAVRRILYQNCVMNSEYANPIFKVIDGKIESWEKI